MQNLEKQVKIIQMKNNFKDMKLLKMRNHNQIERVFMIQLILMKIYVSLDSILLSKHKKLFFFKIQTKLSMIKKT